MVIVIVFINVSIALILFYLAWQIRRIKPQIARFADKLVTAERSCHKVLHRAPNAISKGQRGIHQLRHSQKQEALQLQRQRLKQVVILLTLGQQIWRRFQSTQRVQLLRKTRY